MGDGKSVERDLVSNFFIFFGRRPAAAARKIFGASRAKFFHLYYPAVGCQPVIECEKSYGAAQRRVLIVKISRLPPGVHYAGWVR